MFNIIEVGGLYIILSALHVHLHTQPYNAQTAMHSLLLSKGGSRDTWRIISAFNVSPHPYDGCSYSFQAAGEARVSFKHRVLHLNLIDLTTRD